MNSILKTIMIVIVAIAVAGGLFFAGQAYVVWRSGYNFGNWGAPMMGGYGGRGNQPIYGNGPMMGGRGPMMGGYGPGYAGNLQLLTVKEAQQAAETYIKSLGLDGLEIAEVMIFNNNAYVIVKESGTGIGAFELLVDPVSKAAYPEYGPNMMWNTRYGGLNHGGMMGGRGPMMGGYNQDWNATPSSVSTDMSVTKDQAIVNAQAYLEQYSPGATAADDPMMFYGYYTLDFSTNGKVVGMLSVNGYSGAVFLHTWHGTFIEELEMK